MTYRPEGEWGTGGQDIGVQLDPISGRVLASLVEKQLTTPQQYPLSLNALTLACNQTSNRDPVTSYEEATVREALDRLKADGLVRFVLPSHGRSVVRYRHALTETLALDSRQLALLAVLLLRGPQTAAELRARTERMVVFDRLEDVEADLEGLAAWPEPLLALSGRRPGQKEQRWTHLLFSTDVPVDVPADGASAGVTTGAIGQVWTGAEDDDAGLRAEVAALRRDLDDLRSQVDELRQALGG